MMTGFLAVQGIEVRAETQQAVGEVESAVESMEIEESTGPEGKLPMDENSDTLEMEEEIPADENAEMEEEPEDTEKLLPPTVIPDPEEEPAEKWEDQEEGTMDETEPEEAETESPESDGTETEFPGSDETGTEEPEYGETAREEADSEVPKLEEPELENPEPAGQKTVEAKAEKTE